MKIENLKTENMKTKNIKSLEKIFKGAANHWRLEILFLLKETPNISLIDIANNLNGNFKTISEHTKKLLHAGLIEKKYRGKAVLHFLSDLGIKFLIFFRDF